MSVSQRSPICKGYYEFYKNRPTKFQMELENRKLDTKKALMNMQMTKMQSVPNRMGKAISMVLVRKIQKIRKEAWE